MITDENSRWLEMMTRLLAVADTQQPVIIQGGSKRGAANWLLDLLGGPAENLRTAMPADLVRLADEFLLRHLANKPTVPISVAELLITGKCTKACLLATSVEADACTCKCASKHHAYLIDIEVPAT